MDIQNPSFPILLAPWAESSGITFRVAFLENVICEAFYVGTGKNQILVWKPTEAIPKKRLDQA
jgi:hypothetical protein